MAHSVWYLAAIFGDLVRASPPCSPRRQNGSAASHGMRGMFCHGRDDDASEILGSGPGCKGSKRAWGGTYVPFRWRRSCLFIFIYTYTPTTVEFSGTPRSTEPRVRHTTPDTRSVSQASSVATATKVPTSLKATLNWLRSKRVRTAPPAFASLPRRVHGPFR